MTIAEASEFFKNLKFTEREEIIAKQIMKELHARLGFFTRCRVGIFNII